MRDIEEIYRELLKGKKLISKAGVKIDIGNSQQYAFDYVEDWEVYNEVEDLKRAHKEGAKIEYSFMETWAETEDPKWDDNIEYRIKDGISIESWEKHKEAIKAYWEGAELECRVCEECSWVNSPRGTQSWDVEHEYRVKDDEND
jgi:hypothetical protein